MWVSVSYAACLFAFNFCLSIISSNALILIGQTQTRNKVSGLLCALGGGSRR